MKNSAPTTSICFLICLFNIMKEIDFLEKGYIIINE
jgi:hypothetical protein